MKLFHRVLAGALALLCIVSTFALSPVKTTAESSAGGDQVSYKKKVVSVVYDTSYSMSNEKRYEYARYALQMLVSLLGEKDELTIVPMCNVAGDIAKGKTLDQLAKENTISVDLSNPDRNAVVSSVDKEIRALEDKVEIGSLISGTPGDTTIQVAEQVLVNKGMGQEEDASSGDFTEYWLLVLTDGVFSDIDAKSSIQRVVAARPTLQTIYLSFGSEAAELGKDADLKKYTSFTGIHALESEALLSAMQTITNKISGRYLLSSSAYTISGNKVTINLDHAGLSLKTISLVLQNCGAQLVGATYNGADWKDYISQASVFVPDDLLKLQNGYSAVLSANPYFEGGTLTLEFDKTVSAKNISILLEPALTMEVKFEYNDYLGWHTAGANFDYGQLAPAQKVRVDYVIKELGSDRVVSKSEVDANATITYSGDGNTYAALDEIELQLGNHVIGVLATMLDGAYSMYVPIQVNIKENENFFRVEGTLEQEQNNPAVGQANFTVLYNNFPVGKSDLASYKIDVKLTDSNGNATPLSHTVLADGTIQVNFTLPEGLYGEYKVTATVKHPDTSKDPRTCELAVLYPPLNIALVPQDNQHMSLSHYKLAHNEDAMTFALMADGKPFNFDTRFISYSVKLGDQDVTQYCVINGNVISFVPTRENLGSFASQVGKKELVVSMHFNAFPQIASSASGSVTLVETVYTLTVDGTNSMTFSHHQLSQNTQPFTFVLDAGGYPMNFEDELISYQVKLGSKDITAHCVVNGNVLTYVPNAESFGEFADDNDLKEIVVTVTSSVLPSLNLSQTVRVNLGPTVYEILVVEKGERTFDRFSLKDSGAYIDFMVLRDGIPMPSAELTQAIADKEFGLESKLFKNVFLPTGYTLTASEDLGDGVVRVTLVRDQIGVLATFTGMLIANGDKPLTISFRGVSQNDAFVAEPSPLFAYIWRLMVIAAIIYLIIFAILTPGRGRHPAGALVTLTLSSSTSKAKKAPEMRIDPVGMRLRDRLIFGRILPFIGLTKNQPPKTSTYLTLQVEKRQKGSRGKKGKVIMQPGVEYVNFHNPRYMIQTHEQSEIRDRSLADAMRALREAIETAEFATLKGRRIQIATFEAITNEKLAKAFKYAPRTNNSALAANEKDTGNVEQLSDAYYVCYDTGSKKSGTGDAQKPLAIVFFVKKIKGSKKKRRR